MTEAYILLTAVVFLVTSLVFYFIGKKVGRNETITRSIPMPSKEVIEKLKDAFIRAEEMDYAMQEVDNNAGKIPNREVYDIIYKSFLKGDKIVCDCGEEDCSLKSVLREYRKDNPEQFTKEELNKNDGL